MSAARPSTVCGFGTRTGKGISRPRPLTASTTATASEANASTPTPYTVSVGSTTTSPRRTASAAAVMPSARPSSLVQSITGLISDPPQRDDERASAPDKPRLVEPHRAGARRRLPAHLRQCERYVFGQQRLDVATKDVRDLTERIHHVRLRDRLGLAQCEKRPRQVGRRGGICGQLQPARRHGAQVHPGMQRVGHRHRAARAGRQESGLAIDHGGEDFGGNGGDVPGVNGGGDYHRGSSTGSSPSSPSLDASASGVNGFIMYSCAPAASARTTWSRSPSVVTMISVRSGHSCRARTAAMNSSPSMTGMVQSMQATSKVSPASSMSSASRPLPACDVSNPSSPRMSATIRRIVRESSITSALMPPPCVDLVDMAAPVGHSIPPIPDADDRFRGAQQQEATGRQDAARPTQDLPPGLRVKVDEHVTEEDYVERPPRR